MVKWIVNCRVNHYLLYLNRVFTFLGFLCLLSEVGLVWGLLREGGVLFTRRHFFEKGFRHDLWSTNIYLIVYCNSKSLYMNYLFETNSQNICIEKKNKKFIFNVFNFFLDTLGKCQLGETNVSNPANKTLQFISLRNNSFAKFQTTVLLCRKIKTQALETFNWEKD